MEKPIFKAISLCLFLCSSSILLAQEPSAIADFESTNQGILVPRTDTTTVNSTYSPPATGLLIFQNSEKQFYVFDGTKWAAVGASDADGDSSNELNISASLIGTNFNITDNGGTIIVDLVSLQDGIGTDDQTLAEVLAQSADANALAITNLADPTNDQDAATKKYVDDNDDIDDADNDPANELITSGILDVDTLKITEAGVTTNIQLTGIKDNLGNHMSTENLQLKDNYLSNDGDNEGISINNDGGVAIGQGATSNRLEVFSDSSFIFEVMDQSSLAVGSGQNISASLSAAQSFRVDTTGNLSRIEITAKKFAIPNTTLQLELKTGLDPAAGSSLGMKSFEISSVGDSVYNIVFTTPIPVTKDDNMVMIISYVSGDIATWIKETTNIYSEGNAWVNFGSWSALTSDDHWFKSYIEVPEDNEVSVFSVTSDLNVGIGTDSPDMSAALDINSVTKGLLIPRMTNNQIEAISNPARGLQVYSLDDDCIHIYNGTIWLMDCGLAYGEGNTSPPDIPLWKQIADFPGSARQYPTAFTIGDTAYVGGGFDASYLNDFYKYDPSTDSWTTINSLPVAMWNASSFTLGDKAYVGMGLTTGNIPLNSFYKYDPNTGIWVGIANFPGTPRYGTVAFAIGDTAYVGGGSLDGDEFYKYDPNTDNWQAINNIPGGSRNSSVAFTIGDTAYVGGGEINNNFYKYDPNTGNWTQIAGIPGISRTEAASFVINGKGYVGTGESGSDLSFYSYDPNTGQWTSAPDFIGASRYKAIGFSLNNIGYIGCGLGSEMSERKDFYSFSLEKYYSTINSYGDVMWVNQNDNADKSYVDERWTLDNNGNLSNTNSNDVSIDGSTFFVDVNSNEVGINTNTPSATLDVIGTTELNGTTTMNGFTDVNNDLDVDAATLFVDSASDEVGIGTSNPSAKLDVVGTTELNGTTTINGNTYIQNGGDFIFNGSTLYGDAAANRVGINENFPSTTLDVNGTFRSTGDLYSEGVLFASQGAVFNDASLNSADFRVESDLNASMLFVDASSDRVGIRTDAPSATLEIRPTFYGANDGIELQASNSNRWNINTHSSTDDDLGFYFNGITKGYLDATTSADLIDFTSQHRTKPNNANATEFEDKVGMIVSAAGDIYNLDGSSLPTINESLPKVKLSDKAFDKSIYGVIAGIESPNDAKGDASKRVYNLGVFATTFERVDQDDYRLIVNSGGEGGIWVSNYNGDVENGDLIVSSPIAGIGMRQDDDLIHSYTVAKIVMECNFDLNSDRYECKEVTHEGKTYRMAFLACVYKCD